jgi:heat shock protein HslJ
VKRTVLLLAVLLLASITFVVGCDSSPTSKDVAFEDTDWVMESYGELGNLETALSDVEVTLFFDSTKKQFIGNAGCNTYSGSYKVKGSKLSFPSGVTITLLKCIEEVGQQEDEYVGMFGSADSLEIVDGKLHLICDGKLIIYHEK